MPKRSLVLGLVVLCCTFGGLTAAAAAPVAPDLTTWSPANQPHTGTNPASIGLWMQTTSVAGQVLNGRPTFLASPGNADGYRITASIVTDPIDNDFIGFALGNSTDPSDPATDYLLIDWKQSGQLVDWGDGVGPTAGQAGLAVSRVTGVATLGELWGHTSSPANPAGGVTELARGTTLAGTGWTGNVIHEFVIDYTTSSLDVWVDGSKEISIEGSFPAGPFALYDFSQPGAAFSNITFEALNDPPSVNGAGAGDVDVFEGEVGSTSGSFTDPNGDDVTLTCAGVCAGFSDDGGGAWSWSQMLPEGPTTAAATITASDGEFEVSDTFDIHVSNLAPEIVATSSLASMIPDDTEVAVSADFTDAGVFDTHTAVFDWGDGTTSNATISEAGGSGTASAAHQYPGPGLYTIEVTVWDDDGDLDTATLGQIFVFDPDDFVTGGGWVSSPEGAVTADPAHRGKTTFGFVARYARDGSVQGNLQLQAHGALKFHATRFDTLSILDGVARFAGQGRLDGEDGYTFEVVATDERIALSGQDLFWIEISGPGGLVYGGPAYPTGLPTVGRGIQVHDKP